MAPERPQALRAELERAQSTLKDTLDVACTANLEDADTGELIRLEEVLAIANEAAKEAVSVRRRLSVVRGGGHAKGSREIEDDRGVRWLAFTVYPSANAERPVIREAYRAGWLSFDCGVETRRLAPIPDEWERMADEDLLTLLAQAEPARSARRRTDARSEVEGT